MVFDLQRFEGISTLQRVHVAVARQGYKPLHRLPLGCCMLWLHALAVAGVGGLAFWVSGLLARNFRLKELARVVARLGTAMACVRMRL